MMGWLLDLLPPTNVVPLTREESPRIRFQRFCMPSRCSRWEFNSASVLRVIYISASRYWICASISWIDVLMVNTPYFGLIDLTHSARDIRFISNTMPTFVVKNGEIFHLGGIPCRAVSWKLHTYLTLRIDLAKMRWECTAQSRRAQNWMTCCRESSLIQDFHISLRMLRPGPS